jgi:hypothetical protein
MMASENPGEEYEQRRIGFNEIVKVDKNGQVVVMRSTPYEGRDKKPLNDEAFYLKVGRPDLASAYQRRVIFKIAAGITAGVAILGGGIFALTTGAQGDFCESSQADYNACFARNLQIRGERNMRTRLGLPIIGAGGVLLALAVALSPHPIAQSEAHRLADSYNERLKVDLGLSDESKLGPSGLLGIQARWAPVVVPGGAGLLLSGAL